MFRSSILRTLRTPVVLRQQPRLVTPITRVSFYSSVPALTRDLAKERIIELLEGYDKVQNPEKITEEASFSQDLGLDSLDVVEVVMEVEHEFNIQIPDHEADTLKTVGQTLDYILAQPDAC
ncbi:acyl carrier protein, mitochondrial [[Candida] railenensis]|uniref:Acyl carrier protein n=1 Tax=[Candida] railenensis TaxID=45579 RepID=A0A9P0VXX9_9ASCO|nr:acyl carrier protein, mitochondrial [[Candida] railenensis]